MDAIALVTISKIGMVFIHVLYRRISCKFDTFNPYFRFSCFSKTCQVWYLSVSIPVLCHLSYVVQENG